MDNGLNTGIMRGKPEPTIMIAANRLWLAVLLQTFMGGGGRGRGMVLAQGRSCWEPDSTEPAGPGWDSGKSL